MSPLRVGSSADTQSQPLQEQMWMSQVAPSLWLTPFGFCGHQIAQERAGAWGYPLIRFPHIYFSFWKTEMSWKGKGVIINAFARVYPFLTCCFPEHTYFYTVSSIVKIFRILTLHFLEEAWPSESPAWPWELADHFAEGAGASLRVCFQAALYSLSFIWPALSVWGWG